MLGRMTGENTVINFHTSSSHTDLLRYTEEIVSSVCKREKETYLAACRDKGIKTHHSKYDGDINLRS